MSTEDSLGGRRSCWRGSRRRAASWSRSPQGEGGSPDRALELLTELSELAKSVEEELDRAKRAAEADAQS